MLAGISEKRITPEPGIELCGYLLREQPSTGKLDELYAKTLHLESSGRRILWIHCDLIGFSTELAWRIRRAAAQAAAIDPVNVILTATHTHAGPATLFLRKCGSCTPDYIRFLEKTILDSVREALQNNEEVTVHSGGSTVAGISIDRTERTPAESHIDCALPVLAFKRADGTFKAVLTNFTMHNVGLSSLNRKISADIAGFAAARAKSLIPGQPAVLLTNGACGNINPAVMSDDYSGVESAGTVLGEAIAAVIPYLSACVDNAISASFSELKLPLQEITQQELAEIVEAHRRNFELRSVRAPLPVDRDTAREQFFAKRFCEAIRIWSQETAEIIDGKRPLQPAIAHVHILKIGGIVWVGINAEVFSRMTSELREMTGVRQLYVVGYADGCIGYIAPRRHHERGGYAVNEAHKFYAHLGLAPGSFEILRDHVVSCLQSSEDENTAASRENK